MGTLQDYCIILSTVDYNNDPQKYGRIKCTIPGVIHSDSTEEEAMPWIRPFKMNGYQTFAYPLVGQKVWVLASKTNYNEYWWFPFFETSDLVQNYLNENYEYQPDVIQARIGTAGDAIFTYDNEHGYMMKLGDDFINLKPNRDIIIFGNECSMKIEGNKVYLGKDGGNYEPCVMHDKCLKMRNSVASKLREASIKALSNQASTMSEPLMQAANALTAENLNSTYVKVN